MKNEKNKKDLFDAFLRKTKNLQKNVTVHAKRIINRG